MKKCFKYVMGSLIMIVGMFIVSTGLFSNEAEAATITDNFGKNVSGIASITEGNLTRVNATLTNPCGGQVYVKQVAISVYGDACTLPSKVNYSDVVCGFAVPFTGVLNLVGIYGCGPDTYGVYEGVPLSFTVPE